MGALCVVILPAGSLREQRGPGGKEARQNKKIQLISYLCLVRRVYTLQRVSMKVLLIILPKHSLIQSKQCRKSER